MLRFFSSLLGTPVAPSSKAFFYAALSYDHMLAVGYAIQGYQERR